MGVLYLTAGGLEGSASSIVSGIAVISFTSAAAIGNGQTRFLGVNTLSTIEANVQVPIKSGTVTALRLRLATNTLTGDLIYTLRRNGVATGISITVGAGLTGKFSASGSVAFSANDDISIGLDATAAGAGSASEYSLTVDFT